VLPWLLVHGAMFCKALMIVAPLVTLVVILGVRKAVLFAKHRAFVSPLRSRVTGPREGRVVLEGTLGGGGVNAFHGEQRIVISRDRELFLCGDDVVKLEGEIELSHGARSTFHASLPDSSRGPAPARVWMAGAFTQVEVRSGDRVFVEGIARRSAASAQVSQRETACGWVLEPVDQTIVMCAASPTIRTRPLRKVWTMILYTALVITWFVALRAVGASALDTARAQTGPIDLAQLDDYALAAAMPGTRSDALALLDERIETTEVVSISVARAYARFRKGCGAEVRTLWAYDRLDEAFELAERCHETDLGTGLLILLGHFDDAAPRLGSTESLGDLPALIASGAWSDAARVADTAAREFRGRDAEYYWADTTRFECLRELFHAWAGDAAARPRLLQLAEVSRTGTCALAAGEASAASQRVEVVRRYWPDAPNHREDMIAGAADLADGIRPRDERRRASLPTASPWRGLVDPVMFLAPAIVDRWSSADAPGEELMVGWALRTRLRLLLGDSMDARTDAVAMASVDNGGYASSSFLSLVDRRGAVAAMPGVRAHGDDVDGTLDAAAWAKALDAASLGDGWPLVAMMRTSIYTSSRPRLETLLDILPRVRLGREELARTLQLLHKHSRDQFERSPFDWLEYAALRRDLARMLGDTFEETRWQRIIVRYRNALADRRRVMGMLLAVDWI